MRPLRGLLACLSALLLTILFLTFRSSSNDYDGSAVARTTRSRFRALLAFHTPESLFPPSAIVSLTDDNSTFFLARPAAFGSSLPTNGLSGQLWVGGGFNEEATHRGSSISTEGELGCGDIPGWPFSGDSTSADGKENRKTGTSFRNPKDTKNPARAVDYSPESPNGGLPPSANDGTDDYLHWPLKGAPLRLGAKLPQESHDDGQNGNDKGHADIQSIQETAEIAGKVVLLSRGGCGFLEKTKWVQRRGGVALIVGDNVRGAALIVMYANGDASNVTIPAIFTSHMSAQLLSSLIPSGAYIGGRPAPEIDPKVASSPKKSPKQGAKSDERTVSAKSAASKVGNSKGSTGGSWLSKVGGLIGLGGDSGTSENRRFPDSGRISWVQSDNWEDEPQQKHTQGGKMNSGKSGSNVVKKPHEPDSNGFVIGVHDWRDPDLVALQQEAQQTTKTRSSTSVASTTAAAATAKVYGDSKGKGFSGNNAVPGSGRYSIPGQGSDQSRPEKADDAEADTDKGKWYSKLFNSEVEELTEEEALGLDDSAGTASAPRLDPFPAMPIDDGIGGHQGLWVTITPTTMSASPFFDTLLVLVVSPLVTLTVVYALLLLRARIQRRRWRAPKSVVERLPVRVYHTMSSSSTSSSSQTPSADGASSTSPLLQSDPSSTLSRTRPRSRTTTGANESAALTLDRQREDLASRYEKKYRGRQIECAVCLEEYEDGLSQVMCLPCGHEFHAECITPWLTTRRRTCPICKGDVVRSMAAASSADRSASPSPRRDGRTTDRARSLNRSGTPHSDTPLLSGTNDDLERGRGGRTERTIWRWVPNSLLRLWDRPTQSGPEMADRDR